MERRENPSHILPFVLHANKQGQKKHLTKRDDHSFIAFFQTKTSLNNRSQLYFPFLYKTSFTIFPLFLPLLINI